VMKSEARKSALISSSAILAELIACLISSFHFKPGLIFYHSKPQYQNLVLMASDEFVDGLANVHLGGYS
jgi:hypothetical protein